MLEKGYESSFEHLAFRQLKGAYDCKLVCVPHNYDTMQEALDAQTGLLVFMVPVGRVDNSQNFDDWTMPEGDVVFVFGSPQENLTSFIHESTALHVATPAPIDMMAVCVAAQVLHVYG